ncbi:uncharacterized protein NECHADRAFT_83003 [Fusarium vanettenii 77-13-4]|uniref:Fungal N-terminal domain-containing protein n=1 Tax=Fusarium vanettenii (strain ATCC MYA-4622 / CBS 123669 / FGSC 9596 / NRRL 45880 / 77-13-4) TaxID=660122 RepID=C7ZB80_FUSV7|nr:uncharacterized protein NECHADRAFT_83003 [Fusarium vanettenii 77-13-4]EEU38647.1 predicted protein [Fusarium vanettenii 77-13-4]
MGDLSTLANGFSVIGLADVVCRASIQLYDLIQGLRNAPARQQRYLGILRDLTLTATRVRLWVESHERSTSSLGEGQHELQGVSTILKGSEDQIRQLTSSLTPSTASTWLGRWRSVAGFVWDETLFQEAFDLLEKNNNCLCILLQLCSIKNGVSLSREMKTVSTNFQELRSVLLSSGTTIRQDLGALRDQIQLRARSTPSNAEFQLLSQQIGESSEQLKNLLDDQRLHYSNLDNALVRQADLQKSLLSALEVARKPAFIVAATQMIEANLVRPAPALDSSSHPNTMFGIRNPHQVLLSLLLIRPRLVSCIQQMANVGRMHLSQPEVSWVKSEFELLQRSAAFLLADPTAKEKDMWSCKPQAYTFQPRSKDVQFRHKYADRTAGGLLITDSLVAYDGARESQDAAKFHGYRFACITNPPDCEPSGLLAVFHRKQDLLMTRSPQITRSLRELTIIPQDSPIYQFVIENNVDKMCEIFSKREASPFDYTQDGMSLLAVAALSLNTEAVEFLLQQGADPCNCILDESGAHDIWDVLTNNVPGRASDGELFYAAERLRQTANLLSKRGLDLPEETAGPQMWISLRVAAYFDSEEARTYRVRVVKWSQCRDLIHDQYSCLPFIEDLRERLDSMTKAEEGSLVFMSDSKSLLRPVLERVALCYSDAAKRKFNAGLEFIHKDSVQVEITPRVLGDLAALENKTREAEGTLNCCDLTKWFFTELLEILKKGAVHRTDSSPPW